MKLRILIAGGYGLIGSNIARHIRNFNADIEIILAGRKPEKGEALAQELGGARTVYLDVENPHTVNLEQADLVVAALHDRADALIHAAIAHTIPHIGITKSAQDVGPIMFEALQSPPKRPIVLSGHSDGGIDTIVAKKCAEEFRSIDSIELTALYDEQDPIGPMNANDFEDSSGLVAQAFLREEEKWAWVDPQKNVRHVRLSNDILVKAYPIPLLDVPSLAAITHAPNVRWNYAQGESIGTRAGNQASHDVYIDIEGTLTSGESARRRTVVSDPNGQAHLTGLGIAIVVERVLGLDGLPVPSGGIHLPETLVSPDAAIARMKQFGVQIFSSSIG